MEANAHECDDQTSSGLSKLPSELLTLILDHLDTPDIRSFRLTSWLSSHWANSTFRKLLKSVKFFLHPYSLGLLEELSTSSFADCVERIVIGTETFQKTFHLTSAEYGTTLATTFKRFIHLRAVEIRDFAPHDPEGKRHNDAKLESWWPDYTPSVYATIRSRQEGCSQHYYSRWGDEGDNLHALGIRHVSAQYATPVRKKPTSYPLFLRQNRPSLMEQLGPLFCVTLQACTAAKAAGVNVTDFRVATMYNWAIADQYMADYFREGDRSEQEMFLSSLEVLHLPTYARDPENNLVSIMSACTNLKWLRLDSVEEGWSDFRADRKISACFSEMGLRSQLDRLDLGGMRIGDVLLTSVILQARPKILNVWFVDLKVNSVIQNNTTLDWGWQMLLRKLAGVVEHVRLEKLMQNSTNEFAILLQHTTEPLTLPGVGHGYVALTTENVHSVVEGVQIRSFRWW